jgi:hypothetical protein
MKCEVCKSKIQETFLKKKLGTHVKDKKGKMRFVCPECQKRLGTKQEMLKAIVK